ncbi:MAG: aminoacyl-tRNA hydrolase [Oscillospiraceae bacterium]|nr:aminoacyl-tRNA hydrolase [Oscillospiraceae bacterium]
MSIFEKLKELSAKNSQNAPTGKVEYIIAGLGNPGVTYEDTRHNAGFIAVDALCEKLGVKCERAKFKSMYADVMINGKRCLVMKPTTYMNNSGEAIAEAMQFYKVPPQKLIVIYDDISLEPSKLRIRRKGSDGGHNGIKSIIALTGSQDFPRVKMGVGKKPHPDYNLADWVLSRFTESERKLIDEAAKKAVEAVQLIVSGDTDKAMNLYNS